MDLMEVQELSRLLLHDADSFKRDIDGNARLVLFRRRQLCFQTLQRVFTHLHLVTHVAPQLLHTYQLRRGRERGGRGEKGGGKWYN